MANILIRAPITLSPQDGTRWSDADYGHPYSTSVSASGGTGTLTYSATGLPAGLGIDPLTGVISGTPEQSGVFWPRVVVTDQIYSEVSAEYLLLVQSEAPVAVDDSYEMLADTTLNMSVAEGLLANDISPDGDRFQINVSYDPPRGLQPFRDGSFTYTPPAGFTGVVSWQYQLSNGSDQRSNRARVTITVLPPPLILSPAAESELGRGSEGAPYNETGLSASGGVAPLSFSATGLPDGLSIDRNTGALSGTPTRSGLFRPDITVTDSAAPPNTRTLRYQIVIDPEYIATTISPASGPVGTVVTITGRQLSTAGSVHFGNARAPATVLDDETIQVVVPRKDYRDTDDHVPVRIIIAGRSIDVEDGFTYTDPVVLRPPTGSTLTAGIYSAYYVYTSIAASGGSGPIVFTADNLPRGLKIDAETGMISGRPVLVGDSNITVVAEAESGARASAIYTMSVGKAASTTTLTASPDPSVTGETVTLRAVVAAVAPAGFVPTGYVTFTGPGGFSEVVDLDGTGAAEVASAELASGTIIVRYRGDDGFSASEGSASVTVGAASTTTTVTASPEPSVTGETVTLRALVAAVAPATGMPTGSVTFTGPGGFSEIVVLDSSGVAEVTSAMLTSGTISVHYSGDTGFSASEGTTSVTVGAASTTTTVTASPDPSVTGETVTLRAVVAAVAPATGVPTGSVTFTGPGGSSEIVVLDGSGVAEVTSADLASGTITVSYSGDAGFSASEGSASVTVGAASTTTTVTASPDPSVTGETVTLRAAVTAVAPATGVPAGSVTFAGPGGFSETVVLDATGTAEASSSALVSGTVTVSYSGDAGFSASEGTTSVTVGAASTTTTVTASPDPSVTGETVTLRAVVAAIAPATGVPTGSVTFTGPGGFRETVALDTTGAAEVTSADLISGTVNVSYSGGAGFSASEGSTSVTVGAASTTTTVTASPDPSVTGETVTLRAAVTAVAPATGVPAGSVTFTGPGGFSETVALDATGTAEVSSSVLVSGTVTVSYSGDAGFSASEGSASVTVGAASTTTTVTASPDPSVTGETVTLRAAVTAVAPATGVPAGSVTFTGPGGFSETVALDGSGAAEVSSAALVSGTITVSYSGDAGFSASEGSASVTVGAASTTTTVTASPDPSVTGETVTLRAVVAAVAPATGAPTGSVTFAGPGGFSETVALDATGTAEATSADLASGTITVRYSGDAGFSASEGATSVTVELVAMTIAPGGGELPQGEANVAYWLQISASGGQAPYSFSVIGAGLPEGLTLDPASGELSGVPTAAGRYRFTVRATDRFGNFASAAYAMSVDHYRPDPTQDPEVTGLIDAQISAASRLADNQIITYASRLERLHSETDRASASLMFGNLAFWADGSVGMGDAGADVAYTSAGLSAGLDYRFSERLILGAGLGYGLEESEIGTNGTESRAEARSAILYGSWSPLANLFIDGLYGVADLDFTSHRFVTLTGEFADGRRDGSQTFGQLTATYEFRNETWLVAPYGGIRFSRSRLDGFTEDTGGPYRLTYGPMTAESLSGLIGLHAQHTSRTETGQLKLGARAEYRYSVDRVSAGALGYADLGSLPYQIADRRSENGSGTIGLSLGFVSDSDWSVDLDYRAGFGGTGFRDHRLGANLILKF